MKFYEMEVGKEYRIIFGKDNTGVSKYRINDYGDVEADTGAWHKTPVSHLKLYNYDFEEIEREIDWDKVPKLTPVRVRDKVCEEWKEELFIHKCSDGDFEYMTVDKDNFSNAFDFCEIIGEIKAEWYK